MTADIVAFVLARADEKEAAARSWADTTVPWADFADAAVDEFVHNGEPHTYLAMVDPARVLREVAAVRAIVVLHRPGEVKGCTECSAEYATVIHEDEYEPEMYFHRPWPCRSLRLLASMDSDHPDFDPSWEVT